MIKGRSSHEPMVGGNGSLLEGVIDTNARSKKVTMGEARPLADLRSEVRQCAFLIFD